jgi:hypothetical protein
MKIKNYIYLLFAASIVMFAGCTYDNYTAPQSVLSGTVGYQGQGIGIRSTVVQLELWQHGFQLFQKIPVYVSQDGTYKAILFDGNYLLTYLKGVGPWVTKTDTVPVTVKGNTVVDFPVEPYFFIKSSSFVKSGTNIVGTMTLQQVNTTQTLSAVYIYLSSGTILDGTLYMGTATIAAAAITDKTAPITINVAIPAALATKDYLYARVGVKTNTVTELAYGLPQQISLK